MPENYHVSLEGNIIIKVFLVALAWLVQDLETVLIALLAMRALDFFTGTLFGVMKEGFCSKKSWRGIIKTFAYIVMVLVGILFDKAVNSSYVSFGVPLMAGYVAGSEAISILENLYKLGFPVPTFIISKFKVFKDGQHEKEVQ